MKKAIAFSLIAIITVMTVINQLYLVQNVRKSLQSNKQREWRFVADNTEVMVSHASNSMRHTHKSLVYQTTAITREITELPYRKFRYPLEINVRGLVDGYEKHGDMGIEPINLYPYQYISSASNKCGRNETIFLLLLVKSAAHNFKRRSAIRRTWGNEQIGRSYGIKSVFLLGQPNITNLQQHIDEERRRFNDIIQIGFIDNYFNNTLKTLGGIKWVSRFCNHSQYVLAVDDDYFVAPCNIVKYLRREAPRLPQKLFMGYQADNHPARAKSSKWYMPVGIYPFRMYPSFISGGAILMSKEIVSDLNKAIPYVKLFKFDDVYLGIVMHKLKRKPRNNNQFYITKANFTNAKIFNYLLAAHGHENDLDDIWKAYVLYTKNLNVDDLCIQN